MWFSVARNGVQSSVVVPLVWQYPSVVFGLPNIVFSLSDVIFPPWPEMWFNNWFTNRWIFPNAPRARNRIEKKRPPAEQIRYPMADHGVPRRWPYQWLGPRGSILGPPNLNLFTAAEKIGFFRKNSYCRALSLNFWKIPMAESAAKTVNTEKIYSNFEKSQRIFQHKFQCKCPYPWYVKYFQTY